MDWIDFLGIERTADPLRWRLPVSVGLTGGAGQLFGGCSLGAAVAVLEQLTGRPAAWATAQFLSNAFPGEVLDLECRLVVEGFNFVQAQVTGRVGERDVVAVMAALGTKRFDGAGRWVAMPPAPAPDACLPRVSFGPDPGGLSKRFEHRIAAGEWGDENHSPTGTVRLWMKMDELAVGSSVGLAIGADFLPMGLRAALGRDLFGTSLDNTIRYVARSDAEWVLADLQVDVLDDGVAHGTVHLWTPQGELLAVASQTCGMRELRPGEH